MEFLMTYGWAILVVIIIIALLLNSSIGSDPTLLLQENCEFYITVFCLDYLVEEDQIKLSLQNIAERDIIVKNVIATSDSLEGQCELTGIHMGQPLKNGEDFIFQLNRTVMVDGTFAPPDANINWNPETGGILLAQAHSPSTAEHTQAHDLYKILNAPTIIGHPDFILNDIDSSRNLKYQRWFDSKRREFRSSVDIPEDSQTLDSYKTEAIDWLQDIIDEANAREYAALYVSNKTNESNSSITKSYLFDLIHQEAGNRFIPLPPESTTLEAYAATHAGNTAVFLGCNDPDNLEQARLNYALYTLFDNARVSNDDGSKSRDDLYNVLPESINLVKDFYENEDGSGEEGVRQMASAIEGVFQDPPRATDDNVNNLNIRNTPECSVFDLDDITLTNSQRSDAILRKTFVTDGSFFGLNSITRNLEGDGFSLDAYCALSILNSDFLISDTYLSGSGPTVSENIGIGRRRNFNNDNSIDDVDETGVPFLLNIVNMDRLTDVNRSVYEVARAANAPNMAEVVNRHRYPEKFNGADMEVVLKILQDVHSFDDLFAVTDSIIELILTDDTLDSDSKQQLRDSVIANPPFLRSDYYLDPGRLDAIINIVSDDANVRISDKVIPDVNVRASQIVSNPSYSHFYLDDTLLDPDTISYLIKTVRSDSSFGLDRLDSASRTNRLVEIILIINKIFTVYLDSDDNLDSDSGAIIDDILLSSPELTLTYYSNQRAAITKIVDIARNGLTARGRYSDWYLDTLDSESLIELMNRMGPPNSNYNLNKPLHGLDPFDSVYCVVYPDDRNWASRSHSSESQNILTFYLNLFYDPDVDDHRLFSRFYEDELANPDTVALFHKEYYSLNYEVLTYATVLNVSTSLDPIKQARKIEKGVTRAANIFLFHTIFAPYDMVKTEYTQCYDVDALFPPDTDAFANCMASFVKNHFENLEYQRLIDSDFDNSEDITSFFTDTAGFYLKVLEKIRLSVIASMQEIKEKIDQAFPTPMNVCQAAEDAASDLAILSDSTNSEYARARSDVSAVLDSTGVADKDDILSVLESNPARKDAVDDLFVAFDSQVSGPSGPSIFSNGDLKCEGLPSISSINLLKVIQYISNAAGNIIMHAKEDREAAEAVKRFLEGWGPSQPPDIALEAPTHPASAIFTVNIYATDDDDDLKNITIRMLDDSGTEVEQHNFTIPRSGCNATDCEIKNMRINAADFLNQDITLIAKATDSAGNFGEDDELITIPDRVPPIIEHFKLIALTPKPVDPYHTELILQVNVTDQTEPDLINITIDSTETKITSGLSPPPFTELCDSNPDEEETCVKNFTINVSKEILDREIELHATAYDAKGSSPPLSKIIIIPAESIPGCIHRDLGTKKNRYSLRLIYAWKESPDIDHTITGTLLTTAPDITE